ncbi:MAG: Eco57I restriction-modification methylase domain-containing protein [Chitinivibrionales bacterium]|nr:Eco57I restriction-modification methylase domain-containing protein [Chitinivibrionales bacterium]
MKTIAPLFERPVKISDKLGTHYANSANNDHKKIFGQYLTPIDVADFMAGLASVKLRKHVDILDPGIGSGVLSCALIEKLTGDQKQISSIKLIAYETDSLLLSTIQKSLEYLKKWLLNKSVEFTYDIRLKDFVLEKAFVLNENPSLFGTHNPDLDDELFDIIISNPPYFKISKDDPRARAAARVVYGQPNIYSLFMALSARLLKPQGELIFITPRSYASGPYFRSFREFFFSEIIPLQFHLFGSRTEAFDRDAILQENIILHAKRNGKNHDNTKVVLSFSNGSHDLQTPQQRKLPLKRIVNLSSANKVVFLPTTENDDQILSVVDSWRGSLHNYEMEISTGKVVPFRAIEYLSSSGDISNGDAPLIWMNSIRNFDIVWPFDRKSKPQYIRVSDNTMPLLNTIGNYVLLRRFSAKEEHRRLNSSPLLKDKLPCRFVAFENHVNYIYRPHGKISKLEAIGISAILNSVYLDTYFRVSNGNTQVSATEIRDMPLPDISTIKNLGETIDAGKTIDVDEYLTAHSKLGRSW